MKKQETHYNNFTKLLSDETTVNKIKTQFFRMVQKKYNYKEFDKLEDLFQDVIYSLLVAFEKKNDIDTKMIETKKYFYASLKYSFSNFNKKKGKKTDLNTNFDYDIICSNKDTFDNYNTNDFSDFIELERKSYIPEKTDTEKIDEIMKYVEENFTNFEISIFKFRLKSQMSYKEMSKYSGFSITKIRKTFLDIIEKINNQFKK